MKRCLAIILFLLPGVAVNAQYHLTRAVSEYFRVDPFAGSFSGFVRALTTDTALHHKVILKQTDTTGYYVKGDYDIFNPFSINANRVDMVFVENVHKLRQGRTLSYYTYQLTAYFPDTKVNRSAVKKDYKKLCRKLKRDDIFYTDVRSLKGYKDIEDGEISSFSDDGNFVSPAIVSWQTLKVSKQLALTFLIKIIQSNNFAYPINRTNIYSAVR